MAKINIKKEIVIERNPVERYLLKGKDFLKANRKIALISFIAVSLLGIISIVSLVGISIVTGNQKAEFENLIEKYEKLKYENDTLNAKKTVDEIKKLSESSWFGFTSRMGLYYAGNYYYDLNDYESAKASLEKFIKKSKKNLYWELAALKLGVIHQELKNYDKALETFKQLEADNKEGVVLDQLYYYTANLYVIKKDKVNARKYFNRVINEHSQSPYAAKSKKRLFIMGID